MKRINCLAFLLLAFGLYGCSSKPKDYGYMSGQDYQNRPQLRHSLINSGPLDEATIQKILSSKIVLPKAISLAIVRISDSTDGLDFQMLDHEVTEKLYKLENWGSRVQSIIPVPQLIIAKPVSLESLRHAAVLLQADALLIIKPMSYGDWKFQWFDKKKAKGITSLEVMLMDTRTGAIPFTSMVTETVEILRKDKDYEVHELIERAKRESEAKALFQVAPAVKDFLGRGLN